jgi:hypothetical protein
MDKKIFVITITGVILFSSFSANAMKHNVSTEEKYDLLILCPSEFVSALVPLQKHKESHELKAKITVLEEIYGNFTGRDKPEKIKYYIKSALDNWNITFVLLVGNLTKMPVRYTYPISSEVFLDPVISDLYYADIYNETGGFCSWDSNNNNRFGEYTRKFFNSTYIIDEVDLNPDVYIGRLLCSNSSEVDTVVNKIVNYENNTYNQPWFNNLVLCGGNEHPIRNDLGLSYVSLLVRLLKRLLGEKSYYPFPGWEGEHIGNKVAEIMDGFNVKKLYASATRPLINLFSKAEPLTKRNIKKAFNEGAGFILINAHGSPDSWRTFAPGILRMFHRVPRGIKNAYDLHDVDKLDNRDKLPFIVLNICSGGDFSEDGRSSPIAWEFVKHDNGGAIACLAHTNKGFVQHGNWSTLAKSGYMVTHFFEAYSLGCDRPGSMLAEAIDSYLNDQDVWSEKYGGDSFSHYMTLETLILFGDPSLKLGGYS